ncbi:MAG: 1,4-dihydroxy-2-naphthoate octaprenyltransferase [Candidatus Ranarchaeia archaeon]
MTNEKEGTKKNKKLWLLAPRPQFLTASIAPVLIGLAIVFQKNLPLNPIDGILTLAGVSFIHLGSNLINDYFDFAHGKGTDAINKNLTPFSGGSPSLREKLTSPRNILIYSLICFSLGIIIGLYFVSIKGIYILIIGLFGFLSGFFYVAPPFKLVHRGIGELFLGLSFGPLIVLGTYIVQTGLVSIDPLLLGLPVGILITLVIIINEIPDYKADSDTGKRTIVVRLGLKKSVKMYEILLISVYVITLLLVIFNLAPLLSIISLLTYPKARESIKIAQNNYETLGIIPAQANTIMVHLFTSILFALGFIITPFIGLLLP